MYVTMFGSKTLKMPYIPSMSIVALPCCGVRHCKDGISILVGQYNVAQHRRGSANPAKGINISAISGTNR
jgi:hypothetical protein